MDVVNQLRAVLHTMDSIQVTGRQNLDRLLGCMITVENVIKAVEAEKKGDESK